MKRIHIYLWVLIFWNLFYSSTQANTFIEQKIEGKTVKVIEYDLSSKEYDISIWYSPDATNIRQLMLDNNGTTAINGVFFCPADYSECGWKTFTINEHYIEGEKVAGIYDTTWERVVFWWDKNKVPLLYQTDKINAWKEKDIYEGFANHPLLLKDGENMLEYWYDSFLIDKKMKDSALRNFICSNKEKNHIYFWLVYNVTLDELVPILSKLGCYDALNLDAWKSTAFVYNGKYITWPQRPILDGIIIKRKWLDTSSLDKKAKNTVEKLTRKLRIKTWEYQKKILSDVWKQLNSLKTNIYEKVSSDIKDENWNTNGYRIEIKDLNTLKKIYYINSLNYYISQEINTIKNEEE